MLLELLYILITGLVGLITAAIIYARWNYGTLEKIPGLPAVIKPAFVGGSDVYIYKKIVQDEDSRNVEKYGKVYGYYEGRQAHVYVADPELVRLIFIKDFDHFQNKRIQDYGHDLVNEMLDFLPYEKWKVVRNIISPTLTTGKIRNMSAGITETIVEWLGTVKTMQTETTTFHPKRFFMALTVDVIARCAYATKLNSLHDPDNQLVKNLRSLMFEDLEMNIGLTISQVFPFLTRLIPMFSPERILSFCNLLNNVMKARRESSVKMHDFVDCLNEMRGKLSTPEFKRLGITETTITSQALEFFMAGYETTASTMTNLTYNLAKNPEIQNKVVAEVDSYLARHGGKIEHESIGELVYLAACIQETTRMFPAVPRLERACTKDWHYEPMGLKIPKDVIIYVPVHYIHYNEEYYPEPEKFKPERWLPENKDQLNPYAFLAFGAGNHNCIGMRFAKEEMYLTIAHVLKNFTFKATQDTKIEFKPGRTFLVNIEPFTVEAVKRY